MTKKILGLLLLFWLMVFAWPNSRDNAKWLLSTRGVPLNESGCGGLCGPPTDPYSLGGGAATDPDVVLISSPSSHPADLLSAYPSNKAPLAWWLASSSDAPPPPIPTPAPPSSADSGDDGEVDENAQDEGVTKIEVARRAGALDPGNAFFPWMAAQVELGQGEGPAALADLRRAASCDRYDDYLDQYDSEVIGIQSPNGSTRFSMAFHDLFSEPVFGPAIGPRHSRFRPIEYFPDALKDLVSRFQTEPPGQNLRSDFEMTALIFRIGKLQRDTAKCQDIRFLGVCLERVCLGAGHWKEQNADPPEYFDRDFPAGGADASRLAQVAQSLGRPEVARLVQSEWDRGGQGVDQDRGGAYQRMFSNAIGLAGVARMERLILFSLPLCLVFLILTGPPKRLPPGHAELEVLSLWPGALLGACALGLLSWGDRLVSSRSFSWNSATLVSPHDLFAAGPGLPVALPAVPWVVTGLLVVGAALTATLWCQIMPTNWRELLTGAELPGEFGEIDPLVLFRFLVWAGLCVAVAAVTLVASRYAFVTDPKILNGYGAATYLKPNDVMPHWSWLLIPPMVLLAFLPWWLTRLKSRPAAREAARTRLQFWLTGCLIVLTLSYASEECRRIPMEIDWDAGTHAMVEMGG